MNYLLIGNGFDLSHKFDTRYQDFLKWTICELNLYNSLSADKRYNFILDFPTINCSLAMEALKNKALRRNKKKSVQIEIWNCINDNFWLKYFFQTYENLRDGWTGLEGEIKIVIKHLDRIIRDSNSEFLTKRINKDEIKNFTDGVRKLPIYSGDTNKRIVDGVTTYGEFIKILEEDLAKVIRLFELYLVYYAFRGSRNVFLTKIPSLNIDRVISFNYTNTYSKIYDPKAEVCYIHGKIDEEHAAETDNLVLGIEEYLDEDRASSEIELISFKKYYQRLKKKTGTDYLHWIDEIKDSIFDYTKEDIEQIKEIVADELGLNPALDDLDVHKLYIIGHSLDVTDADILKGFILNDNVKTIIYFFNENDYANKIANLVRVIGKDELIRRTAGREKSIFFVDQKDLS